MNRDTYINKEKNQSPNDRNDKGGITFAQLTHSLAIRVAVKWYNQHMPRSMSAVLVTDDSENRKLATADGIPAYSGMSFYCTRLTIISARIS